MAGEDAAVGRRLRLARVAKGLSQQDVAVALSLSASYVSLMEAGKRPVSSGLLDRLGALFGTSPAELRSGVSSEQADLIDLDLRFAEIALRNGEAPAAQERFQHALEMLGDGQSDAWITAQFGLARSLEMQGALEPAIQAYESLLTVTPSDGVGSAWQARINIALCRIYSECGDLNRAVELGEQAMDQLPPAGEGDPAANEAYVALVSTLAGCYYERGDLTRAHLLAGEAINRAHVDEQPTARASAYWNAAIIAEARGETAEARRLVDRAHALFAESDNVRALALLKLVAAWLILREPDPALDHARQLLEAGLEDLANGAGSQVDLAYGEVELARCKMFEGDWEAAVELSEQAIGRVGPDARLQGARARLTLGQALLLGGEREQAMAIFDAAADDLRATGADRQAAEAWRELGEVHASLGRDSDAIEAYRRAADAAGVTLTNRPQPVRLAAPRRP